MSEDSIIGVQEEIDYTPDATDRTIDEQYKETTEEELRERLQRENEKEIAKKAYLYYLLFSSPDGMAVLEDMEQAYMYRSSLDEMNPDPYLTAYCEGQRNVVLQIRALMKIGMENPI